MALRGMGSRHTTGLRLARSLAERHAETHPWRTEPSYRANIHVACGRVAAGSEGIEQADASLSVRAGLVWCQRFLSSDAWEIS